jgi:glycosyltransferase involved in cell wall biosynthesis
MLISVIIPTYRRPQDLQRCLEALGNQVRSADEIIVIVRDVDEETWKLANQVATQDILPLRACRVERPGVIAAMNVGLVHSKGDIIAFTDDDAAPHRNWLKNIEAHFRSDDQIGGVGGRDFLYINNELARGEAAVVGKLKWFGSAIGNHHLGVGLPREVDILKGVNMSYRRKAIVGMSFDKRMLGSGAQVHFELMWCLSLKKRGWKLIYDPNVAVDHFQSPRFDEDQREKFENFNFRALGNQVHNQTLSILENVAPSQRFVYLMWSLLVGTQGAFGLVQFLRFLPRYKRTSMKMLFASVYGHWQGFLTWSGSKNE